MVASLEPIWMHGGFSTLAGLFTRVALNTKTGKTVGMVCRPYQEAVMKSEAEKGRQVTGAGTSYRERKRVWVQ